MIVVILIPQGKGFMATIMYIYFEFSNKDLAVTAISEASLPL